MEYFLCVYAHISVGGGGSIAVHQILNRVCDPHPFPSYPNPPDRLHPSRGGPLMPFPPWCHMVDKASKIYPWRLALATVDHF